MDLKDIIISTLAEMEEEVVEEVVKEEQKPPKQEIQIEENIKKIEKHLEEDKKQKEDNVVSDFDKESEIRYLSSLRERFLVLFEGFQSPQNNNIEAKLDLTLNFLEYVLATLDTRIEMLKKGKKE
ncbi:FIG00469478: hypothetical protein [hydrothermal vent metagenome]|uniref:Campylobacter invasion antigen D C-terminal domain-containing protein n=1 Tax=hydrothermal vent metagenome TaxID=652676 RepID=A0A1W1D5D5_9ZZZZ